MYLRVKVEPATADLLRELSEATGLSMSFLLELMIENFEGRWKEAKAESGGERAKATESVLKRLRRTIDTTVNYDPPPSRSPDGS